MDKYSTTTTRLEDKPSTKSQCLAKEGIGQRSNKEPKSHSERAGELHNSVQRNCSQSNHSQDDPESFMEV